MSSYILIRPQISLNSLSSPHRNQCTVFRPWQGWTALSHTGAREGTLQVLPLLTLSTAYIMLRPFFALRPGAPAHSLAADDWVLDLESTAFPGSTPGRSQEPTAGSHPHLALEKTVVSIPRVEPGDQVYCERRFSLLIHQTV